MHVFPRARSRALNSSSSSGLSGPNAAAAERSIQTVESFSDDERLHPVQRAFVEAGAVQCGFCTPGLVVATYALLKRNPEPSEQEVREAPRSEAWLEELEAVTAALRRRVGQSFTLAELADAYASAEVWSREAVEETEPASGWPRRLSTVTDAAFHLYSRGAVDYEP